MVMFLRNSRTAIPESFFFILYQDAFGVANPLGLSRAAQKMLAVYYTLVNLPGFIRSQVDPQQLVLLCYEKDVKCFGTEAVFSRLVHDLKTLEKEGILFSGQQYKVCLAFVAGDNLGSHFLGGFIEHFSSGTNICRYCDITMNAFKKGQLEGNIRTVESYNFVVQQTQSNSSLQHYKGVKKNSLLNTLSGFHVCMPGLPPCLGHDLLEGIVNYDMALMIRHRVITLKWFSYEHLNAIIGFRFKYSCHDLRNKPACVQLEGKSLGEMQCRTTRCCSCFP